MGIAKAGSSATRVIIVGDSSDPRGENYKVTPTPIVLPTGGDTTVIQGTQGKSVELRVNSDDLQWRWTDASMAWTTIYDLSTLADGTTIDSVAWSGNDMVFTLNDASTVTLTDAKTDLKGDKGDTGTGSAGADGDDGIAVVTADAGATPSDANVDTAFVAAAGRASKQYDALININSGANEWHYWTREVTLGDWTDRGSIKGDTGSAGTNGTNGTNGTDGKDGQALVSLAAVDNSLAEVEIAFASSSGANRASVEGDAFINLYGGVYNLLTKGAAVWTDHGTIVGTGAAGAAGIDGVDGADGDLYSTTISGSITLSSLTIGVNTGTLTVADSGMSYTVGQILKVYKNSTNYFIGEVYSFSGTSLVLTPKQITGTAANTDWTVNLGGALEYTVSNEGSKTGEIYKSISGFEIQLKTIQSSDSTLTLTNNASDVDIILGTVSHTNLDDIGTNTHTQIDTFISTTGGASYYITMDDGGDGVLINRAITDPTSFTETDDSATVAFGNGLGSLATSLTINHGLGKPLAGIILKYKDGSDPYVYKEVEGYQRWTLLLEDDEFNAVELTGFCTLIKDLHLTLTF